MPVVPGTKTQVVFYSFAGINPHLYYAKHEGKLNLASVNAGNSNVDGLCVGLKGVNGGFFDVLSATQKRVNNSSGHNCRGGANDDYQDRHLKLLATADSGGTPWASYSNTDPCALSFVNSTRISKAAGFYEGVCFVDVFDPMLCPEGNPRNAFMLYAAPPFDGNYATQAVFLKAIEAMARNIVQTISAYNVLAAQNNWLPIESLRNTLFSSNIYNQHLQVPLDAIARAIFEGFTAELNNDSHSGLVELQFPVGDSALHQAALFAVVEQDLAGQAAAAPHHFRAMIGGNGLDPNPDDDNDPTEDPNPEMQQPDDQGEDADSLEIGAQNQNLTQAATALETATKALDPILKGNQPFPTGPYGRLPLAAGHGYESLSSPIGSAAEYEMLPTNAARLATGPLNTPTGTAARATAQAALDVLQANDDLLKATTLDDARALRDNANAAASTAENRATDAEAEAAQQGATEQDAAAAAAARTVATNSRTLANEMDAAVRTQEALARIVYRDVNGRLAVGRVLAPVLGSLAGLVAAGLVSFLGWLYGSQGGRLLRNRPQNRDLSAAWLDDGTTADVDVLAQNVALDANFDPTLVKAVHLFQNSQQSDSIGTAGATDVWTVTSSGHITFAPLKPPASGSTITIPYILEFISGSLSTAASLTITFVDKASTLVQPASKGSAGKITAVFPITLPDQFVFDPADPSAWTLDKVKKTLTYAPLSPVTSAVVSESYSLGLNLSTNTAQLVVLLPPTDLTPLSASPASMLVSFPALPDPGPATWTLLLNGSPAMNNKISVAGGDWSLAMNTIMFKPSTTTPPSGTLSVSFALTLDNVTSLPATAAIDFTSTTPPVPTTMNLSRVAPNRTDASFPVTLPSMVTNFKFTSGTTTLGTWDTLAGGSPTFTPSPAQFGPLINKATNNYTADGLTGTVTIIFPLDIAVSNADRKAVTPIDLAGYNSQLTNNFTISVQDTNPPADSSNATWQDGAASMARVPGTLLFEPPSDASSLGNPGSVLQISSATKLYVLTFPDKTQTTAKLTLNFTTALTAYDFTYAAQATESAITIDFLPHCYIPSSPGFRTVQIAGGQSPTYVETNPQTNATEATWTAVGMGTTSVIDLSIADAALMIFTLDYAVVDLSNAVSNPAKITVTKPMMAMPQAGDYMLTKDIWSAVTPGNEQLAVDVLSVCSSFYDVEPTSVVITGLFEMGQDFTAAPAAILDKTGKALRIPEEGSWLVDNTGLIGFHAVSGLTHPPTPIAYQFSDKKGNLSNQGKIVVDPLLDQASSLPKALSAMDDTAFWGWFQPNVSRRYPRLTRDEFVATTTVLAGATRTLGKVGRNPVSGEAFAKAFETWFQNGKHWDDRAGTAHPVGLFSVCRDLVEPATAGTGLVYRARYWRLLTMSRMAAHSPILPVLKR